MKHLDQSCDRHDDNTNNSQQSISTAAATARTSIPSVDTRASARACEHFVCLAARCRCNVQQNCAASGDAARGWLGHKSCRLGVVATKQGPGGCFASWFWLAYEDFRSGFLQCLAMSFFRWLLVARLPRRFQIPKPEVPAHVAVLS